MELEKDGVKFIHGGMNAVVRPVIGVRSSSADATTHAHVVIVSNGLLMPQP